MDNQWSQTDQKAERDIKRDIEECWAEYRPTLEEATQEGLIAARNHVDEQVAECPVSTFPRPQLRLPKWIPTASLPRPGRFKRSWLKPKKGRAQEVLAPVG